MRWFRANPPASSIPPKIRRVLSGNLNRLIRLGVHDLAPFGCGTFGCTFARDKRTVVKVTTDPYEVKMVSLVRRLRGKRGRVTRGTRRDLADLGYTVEQARTLPGIVRIHTQPVRLGGKRAWAYVRESVLPIDAMHDSRASLRMRRAGKALDRFFYDPRSIDLRAYAYAYPEMRAILATAIWLQAAHSLRLEDVHEEQVGKTVASFLGRPAGTYVLYDGQVD